MSKLHWREDADLIAKLRSLGQRWEKRQLTFGEIDFEGSKTNNARNDPYDADIALEFITAMLSGDVFPSICCRNPDSGYKRYPILSGVHRTGAIGIGIDQGDIPKDEPIEAIVIPSDNPMICELVERAANRWHGRRTGPGKAVMDAQWMIDRYGLTVKDCARHFCLRPEWLGKCLKRERTKGTLSQAGVAVERITDTSIDKLAQLDFNDTLQDRAARMIAAEQPTGADALDLVKQVKAGAKQSEQKGIEAIKNWQTRYRQTSKLMEPPTRAATTRTKYRARFFTYIVSLHGFMLRGNAGGAFESLQDLQVIDLHDQHEIRTRWRELKRMIDNAFRASKVAEVSRKRDNGAAVSRARRKKGGRDERSQA